MQKKRSYITYNIFHRGLDVGVSLVGLMMLLPFFPIIAFIIKYQSPGPLFFSQERTGLDGKTFRMYKFRSMHVNNESNTRQATVNDPRKFPFGKIMRRTSIDELPQLVNILIGDMSVIGPRPHMLAHTEYYTKNIPFYMERHAVRPGLTGWAQVTGWRGDTPEVWMMEGRVIRDLWYIDHRSVTLDIRILLMTVLCVIFPAKGAH